MSLLADVNNELVDINNSINQIIDRIANLKESNIFSIFDLDLVLESCLNLIGQRAVTIAQQEFSLVVKDDPLTPNFNNIQKYLIEGCDVRNAYRKNGSYAWCGCFVAYCYKDFLSPVIRYRLFRSTYRLFLYALNILDANLWTYNSLLIKDEALPVITSSYFIKDLLQEYPRRVWFPNYTRNKYKDKWWRTIEASGQGAFDIMPGDIMTVGGSTNVLGSHIVLVESSNGDTINTVEGNATGLGADGTTYEGVVRKSRTLSEVVMIVRPSVIDCINFLQSNTKVTYTKKY
jgi:hypothetical protein